MRGKPGTLALMPDGRMVIIYNAQPLLKEKNTVVVHLIDDEYKLMYDGDKPKTLLFTREKYNEEIKSWKACGKVD